LDSNITVITFIRYPENLYVS